MKLRCIACGSEYCGKIFDWRSGISLYECRECEVQFFHPVKHPTSKYYEESETYIFPNISPELGWEHKQFFKDEFFTDPRGRRLLDIGCGNGKFLYEASKIGYDVYGIDINRNSVRYAHEKFGLKNVFCSTLEDYIKSNPGRFDVITFFEVLEHLDNPKEFIDQVKMLESKYIVLSVPNRDRTFDYLGEGDFPPNHLTRWSVSSVVKLLSRNGIGVQKIVIKPLRYDDISNWLGQRIKFGIITKRIARARESCATVDEISQQISSMFRLKKAIFDMIGFALQILFFPFKLKGSNMYIKAVVER